MLTFKKKFLFAVIASTLSSSVFAAPQLFTKVIDNDNGEDSPLLKVFQQEHQDYKLVTINQDVLHSRTSSFLFQPDEQSPEIEIKADSLERDAVGNEIWQGYSSDAKNSATFSTRNGVVNGSIRLSDDSVYQFYPLGKGIYSLVKVDDSHIPEKEHDDIWDETSSEKQHQFTESLKSVENLNSSEEKAKIKVLYVYTHQSRYRFGDDPLGHAGLLTKELNLSYSGSDTLTEFELVGAEDARIDESTMSTMLDQMKSTDNTLGKFVAEKRAQTRADLVVLIVERNEYCGVSAGWGPYSVVKSTCATSKSYALAHEIGHNFGLKHNEDEATWPLYANGYKVPGKFRTIMSKDCTPTCTRINYFSDPRKDYGGVPRGTVASNDSVRFIKERRFIVANYFPDWESKYVMNQGELPANQYFTVTLTDKQTNKTQALDHVIVNPDKWRWPYELSVAANKFFGKDIIAAGMLATDGKVEPKDWSSFENNIWLHQDKLATYKVDVERKTYAVVNGTKWGDMLQLNGGDGMAANTTMMLTIKNKSSGQILENYYFNNDGENIPGYQWPHQIGQIVNAQKSSNVIVGELSNGNVGIVGSSGYRNRVWLPLDKKNELVADVTLLSAAENPWIEQKDIFGDKFQTDLASGTTITVAVKNSSGAVVEQRSVLIPDGDKGELLSRFRWPAYLAHEINKSMTQVRLGGKQADGSIKVVEWSQYLNYMWKKDRANQTVVVTFSK